MAVVDRVVNVLDAVVAAERVGGLRELHEALAVLLLVVKHAVVEVEAAELLLILALALRTEKSTTM